MHPLESLRCDHRLIFQLTDALDAYRAVLLDGTLARPGDLGALTLALRALADYRHFEKEEQVLEHVLVRNGYNWNLRTLLNAREVHRHLRYLMDVLEHAAQRESQWSQPDRWTISETLLDFSREQSKLAMLQEIELFPEILTRLEPAALGELTARLEHFDAHSDAWAPAIDIGALCQDIKKHCAVLATESFGSLSTSVRARSTDMESVSG